MPPPEPAELGKSPDALVAEGRQCAAAERNASALRKYDQALALDPAHERAWLAKAILLEDLERPDEALACYDALLALQPDNLAALSNRGGLLAQQGRTAEALAALDRALALYPNHPVLTANRAQLTDTAQDTTALPDPPA